MQVKTATIAGKVLCIMIMIMIVFNVVMICAEMHDNYLI